MEQKILDMFEEMETNTFSESEKVFEINKETREIELPLNFEVGGVESDEKAERIRFKSDRYVGDNLDLSMMVIKINYKNANGEIDQNSVENIQYDDDYITFDWVPTRKVTKYKGNVSFIICAKKIEETLIKNEWNTTIAKIEVLEGIETSANIDEEAEARDLLSELLQEITDFTEVKKTEIQNQFEELYESIPPEYTELTEEVSSLSEEMVDKLDKIVFYGGTEEKEFDGSYLINSPGVIGTGDGVVFGTNQNWFYTDYLAIREESVLTVTVNDVIGASSGWGLAFYDKNKSFLSGYGYTDINVGEKLKTPPGSAYIRYSDNSASKERISFHCTTIILQENCEVNSRIYDIVDLDTIQRKSNIDSYLKINHIIDDCGMQEEVSGEYRFYKPANKSSKVCGFIPVMVGDTYRVILDLTDEYTKSNYIYGGCITVIDGEVLNKFVDDTFSSSNRDVCLKGVRYKNAKVSSDGNSAFIDIHIDDSINGENGLYVAWVCYLGTNYLELVVENVSFKNNIPYTDEALSVPPNYNSYINLARKNPNVKIYALGDSTNSDDATRLGGVNDNDHFSASKVIAYRMNAIRYVNYSAPGIELPSIFNTSKDIPNDATIVIIVGGINDITRVSRPVGDIDAILAIDNVDDIPETTMLGIYVKMVKLLRNRLPKNAQIICVSPYQYTTLGDERDADLNLFKAGLKKMCDMIGRKKGMRFIDGANVGITNENYLPLCRDGIHPEVEGQTIIATHIMEHITPPEIAGEQYDLQL